MSASASTVPAVQAKLLELFKAAVEAPTEVWASRPNEDHQLEENVYLGKARGRRTFKTLGAPSPHGRQEDFTVLVEVEVFREGTDVVGVQERAWVIAAQLEATVSNNPGLSNLENVTWAIVSEFEENTTTNPEGVLTHLALGVTVNARI